MYVCVCVCGGGGGMVPIKIVYKRRNGLPLLKSATTHPLTCSPQPEMLSGDEEMVSDTDELSIETGPDEHDRVSKA